MYLEAHLLGVQRLARCELFSQNMEKVKVADWLSEPEHGEGEFVNEPAERHFYAEFQLEPVAAGVSARAWRA